MMPIVTLTFSPCIDKSTTVPSLVPEKKLTCAQPKLDAGGGGINVARAIKHLGGDPLAIFPSGGYTGKFFNHLIEQEAVPFIHIETKNETRENIIVLESSSNKQFRFGMPGTELLEKEWQQCLHALEDVQEAAFIVASGSLPPGVPGDMYARIAKIARKKKIKLVVDTSGEALKHAISEGVYLVKPNLGELASLAGKESMNADEAEELAKNALQENNCEVMVVSLGGDGAMLVTKEETVKVTPPEVDRKSTVGAGDSMVAGIVFSLAKGMSLQESLMYGVACGTAATMNAGTDLCRKEDADRLFDMIIR